MIKQIAGVLIVVAVLVVLLVVSGAFYTVKMTEQVIITQFGKPVGDPVTDAGLHLKLPFVQDIQRIEKRILEWDGARNEMPTRDKLYISVDTFGRWRIADPLLYFQRLRNERSAQSRLEDILGSETRNAVAKHDLIEIVRSTKDREPTKDGALKEIEEASGGAIGKLPSIRKGRTLIEQEILTAAKSKLTELGVELLDIRFKRINYNQSVQQNIFQRMISERQQIASKFRSEGEGEAARILGDKELELERITSEGYKAVQEIRGAADARATAIYASAYGKNSAAEDLYEFVKSMETYKSAIDSDTTLILSTESDLFKYLKSADGK